MCAFRRYTPNDGSPSTVWFDRLQVSPFVSEDTVSIDEMCKDLDELVDMEVREGIPLNRIIVGGCNINYYIFMPSDDHFLSKVYILHNIYKSLLIDISVQSVIIHFMNLNLWCFDSFMYDISKSIFLLVYIVYFYYRNLY